MGWLGWLGLLILATGGVFAYLLYTHETDPVSQQAIAMILAVTVIASGICFICATADWWINR